MVAVAFGMLVSTVLLIGFPLLSKNCIANELIHPSVYFSPYDASNSSIFASPATNNSTVGLNKNPALYVCGIIPIAPFHYRCFPQYP